MSFFSQDDDFGPVTYSATNEEFDDLIRLNENEPWDLSNPMSPDRQSLSSSSSGDGVSDFTDFSEMCPLPNLNTDLSGLEMPIVEEDAPADFAPTRRGRSVSRAPISRASSNRRYRRTPYGADHARSSSVMSTSSNMSAMAVSLPPTQCCSPVEECHDDFMVDDFKNFSAGMTNSSMLHGSSFHGNNGDFNSFYSAEQLVAPKPMYSCDTLFLSSTFDDSMFDNPVPNVLPSSDLSSEHVNGARDGLRSFADEPDLFGPLSEEPSVPSEEDMKPEDSEMEPSVQELRFEGDLYTPKFVRGHGNKREGYCGLCKPGRWLVLKNSAFWYDKSFTHGISAATGQPFDAPKETRRMSGNPDVWEGLCGTCGEWIALISNKKKGTTWFRHAYKVRSNAVFTFACPNYLNSAIHTKKPRTHRRSGGTWLKANRKSPRAAKRKVQAIRPTRLLRTLSKWSTRREIMALHSKPSHRSSKRPWHQRPLLRKPRVGLGLARCHFHTILTYFLSFCIHPSASAASSGGLGHSLISG